MTVSQEIRSFMAANGKKGGATNKKKGKDYFSMMGKISAERKRQQKLSTQVEKVA